MVVLVHLITVVICIALLVLLGVKAYKEGDQTRVGIRPMGLLTAVLIFVAVILLNMSFGQISYGKEGVVTQFGATTGRVITQGFYTKAPWQSVVVVSIQIQAYETPAEAASKDLQDVSSKVTLNFRLDPSKVADVVRTLGDTYTRVIIVPAVQESVKAVTAKYDAGDLIGLRADVKNAIVNALTDRLSQHGIIVDTLSITDFKFSPTFTTAIEAKVGAVQRALEAENKLKQVQIEAQQAAAQAEGQKNAAIQQAEGSRQAAILNADGQAQAILKVAKAQADANDLLNKTITDQIIKYTTVQKLSPDIKVILLPSGQNFLLDSSLLGGTNSPSK